MASRLLWASRVASYLRVSVSHRGFASVVKDLKYAESHEWVKVDGKTATVGITDHAQDHLGDVVYVELPDVGHSVTQGSGFGAVESVKATSDVYSPVSGKVVQVNEELNKSPGLVVKSRISTKVFMFAPGYKVTAFYVLSCLSLFRLLHGMAVIVISVSCVMFLHFYAFVSSGFSHNIVNTSPYEDGWIIKVEMSDTGEVKNLMDSEKYSKFCEEEDAKH
ncbi:hypothetical protein FEM48_Zijuj01G0116000 [Ziziphus jujuba var. spinosa]|uniref:Glycine cleavage system H protein n=1 Tax=Ziziphus jujuba var. spinosa TaxID=714518 RepID=A0A978W116_ZIZJJ|nr:hypothetical protein FEM48_Zijuj01G0116000 [Ziziphus jujuba var. spinosa]